MLISAARRWAGGATGATPWRRKYRSSGVRRKPLLRNSDHLLLGLTSASLRQFRTLCPCHLARPEAPEWRMFNLPVPNVTRKMDRSMYLWGATTAPTPTASALKMHSACQWIPTSHLVLDTHLMAWAARNVITGISISSPIRKRWKSTSPLNSLAFQRNLTTTISPRPPLIPAGSARTALLVSAPRWPHRSSSVYATSTHSRLTVSHQSNPSPNSPRPHPRETSAQK